jgi:PadR family transcriptional regulator, regulatory protein PadR
MHDCDTMHRMVPTPELLLVQLRKGVLDYCVLASLRGRPAYGLELAERLGRDGILFVSEGTLYPLLSRLRKQGWVETAWRDSPLGPPRRYYELTPIGAAALAVFETTWATFTDDVRAVLGPPSQESA